MKLHRHIAPRACLALGLCLIAVSALAQSKLDIEQANEDYIHTPSGFDAPGKPAITTASNAASLKLIFIDAA